MSQHVREPGVYLDTLAFRCTPELVGDDYVYVRHFDDATTNLWRNFDFQCRQQYGDEDARAPFTIATTVLKVLSGGYVHFEVGKGEGFLASREPLDDNLVRRVFTLTYGLALGEQIEHIDLRNSPEVATRIASTVQTKHHLAEYLTPTLGTQPNAPSWVYRTITWGLSQRLAKQQWQITGGQPIALRSDSTGGLVTPEHPWENDQGGRFALSRTRLELATIPNINVPVLIATSHVTRISSSVVFSKTALAVPDNATQPVLEVTLNGRGGARTISRLALQVLGRLEMDYSLLREIDQRSQDEQKILAAARQNKERPQFPREHPARVWPIMPKTYTFPIGVGVGMQHLRDLHGHACEVFGDAALPLTIRRTSLTWTRRPTDLEKITKEEEARRKADREATGSKTPLKTSGTAVPKPESIAAAVRVAGFTKLRIACLWYSDEARKRMLDMLKDSYKATLLDPRDGEECSLLGDQVTVVFHYAPDFLKPGSPQGRRQVLQPMETSLMSTDGTLVGAWCETELPVSEHLEHSDHDTKKDLDDLDAKYQTKLILAQNGIPSQYMLGRDEDGPIVPKAKDHPAEMALLDLYRSLGLIDDRTANALKPSAQHAPYAADHKAHVGIHIRQQNKRKGERATPKVVVTATAFVPPKESGGVWTLLGWSSTKPIWRPYRSAQTEFHATAYPQETGMKKTYRQRWDDTAETVERALEDLADELDGIAYTVTVDAAGARRAWDGLQNIRQGAAQQPRKSKYWLPGDTLTLDMRPEAIIRLDPTEGKVPPPVGTTRWLKGARGQRRPGQTSGALYEIETDFGTPVWLLSNIPRSYDGNKTGRLGSKYTRWSAKRSVYSEVKEERRKGEMSENWYSMTVTEIFPIACKTGVSLEAIAFATAEMCNQTLYWTGRSRYPAPLHAAKQMDLDHPQYRRTISAEEFDHGEARDLMAGRWPDRLSPIVRLCATSKGHLALSVALTTGVVVRATIF